MYGLSIRMPYFYLHLIEIFTLIYTVSCAKLLWILQRVHIVKMYYEKALNVNDETIQNNTTLISLCAYICILYKPVMCRHNST